MANYYEKAQQQYDPSYNAKRTALLNQLASNQQAIDGQVTGVNQNYDGAVSKQNLNNVKAKNNLANTYLGRNLTRCTSQFSALGEADQINNRRVGEINTERTGALNNLAAQRALIEQNTNNTLGTMAGDRESSIWSLANQLEDRDFSKGIQQQQLEIQRAAQAAEQAYREKQLAFEMQKYKDQSSSSPSNPFDDEWFTNASVGISTIENDDSMPLDEKIKGLNSVYKTYSQIDKPEYRAAAQKAADVMQRLRGALNEKSGIRVPSFLTHPDIGAKKPNTKVPDFMRR
jgi:hypothetical protein